MGLNRYSKRRDANESEIVKALRAIGCTVMQTDAVDLIVGVNSKTNLLMEIKTETGKLKPSQEKLLQTWRGQYAIVRTVEEAINLVDTARKSV